MIIHFIENSKRIHTFHVCVFFFSMNMKKYVDTERTKLRKRIKLLLLSSTQNLLTLKNLIIVSQLKLNKSIIHDHVFLFTFNNNRLHQRLIYGPTQRDIQLD